MRRDHQDFEEIEGGPRDRASEDAAGARHSDAPYRDRRDALVQRRRAGGVDTIRGAVLTRLGPTQESRSDLTTYDDWRGALTDVTRLSLEGVRDDDQRGLWSRVEPAHHAWDAAGRP